MKLYVVLLLGLLVSGGDVSSQGVLCPSSGLPVSQDPGCWARENAKAAQQQQPQPQPIGYWQKTWGAIAPSPVGGVLGTAVGATSKKEAERQAMRDCKAKGGTACEVRIAFYNQCAVMVLGDNIYRTARAGSIEDAARLGIGECSREDTGCRVYYSVCTEPIFHKH
jgi:hypothetical protein